jgi:hypothetical protein
MYKYGRRPFLVRRCPFTRSPNRRDTTSKVDDPLTHSSCQSTQSMRHRQCSTATSRAPRIVTGSMHRQRPLPIQIGEAGHLFDGRVCDCSGDHCSHNCRPWICSGEQAAHNASRGPRPTLRGIKGSVLATRGRPRFAHHHAWKKIRSRPKRRAERREAHPTGCRANRQTLPRADAFGPRLRAADRRRICVI